MIKLKEILHTISKENKNEELVPIDNWPFRNEQFLTDMGFKSDGIYHYSLKKPELVVSLKKGVGYILKDKDRNETKTFSKFNELEDYFAKYPQKWETDEYLEENTETKIKTIIDINRMHFVAAYGRKRNVFIPKGTVGVIKDILTRGMQIKNAPLNKSAKKDIIYSVRFPNIGYMSLYDGEFEVIK
jgi:hypothetical protein